MTQSVEISLWHCVIATLYLLTRVCIWLAKWAMMSVDWHDCVATTSSLGAFYFGLESVSQVRVWQTGIQLTNHLPFLNEKRVEGELWQTGAKLTNHLPFLNEKRVELQLWHK